VLNPTPGAVVAGQLFSPRAVHVGRRSFGPGMTKGEAGAFEFEKLGHRAVAR